MNSRESHFKKIILAALFFIILGFAFYPALQARADVPVLDSTLNLLLSSTQPNIVRDIAMLRQKDVGAPFDLTGFTSLDAIAGLVAKGMIKTFSTSIVNWIKTGDSRGPLFIEDFLEHFTREMDNAVGLFLEKYFGRDSTLLGLLCEPFRLTLPPLLNVHRRGLDYTERARCKLSDIVHNVENFQVQVYFDDFSHGGWDAWFSMLEPEHNIFGQYLMGVSELERRRAGAFLGSQTEVQTTGGGLLSWKKCETKARPSADGIVADEQLYEDCKIQTPGGLVQEQLRLSETSWIRQLEVADEINEILVAFFQKMINDLLSPSGGFSQRNVNTINQTLPADSIPPTVSITSPASNQLVSISTPVTIMASAFDDIGVVGVRFFINGVPLGAEDTTSPYSVLWDTRTFAPGTYSLSAQARDASGKIGSSPPVTVTLQ